MKVTKEKVENSQAFLTIEMEPAEMAEGRDKGYRRLVQKAKIPGFRKGKAPRQILEHYLGKEALLEEAINIIVPEAYEKALKEQELKAITHPKLEVTQAEPLVFKAVVPLSPEVKLGDYGSIRLTPKPVEVKEEANTAALEQIRHQQATWEVVERPVDFGDLVAMDIESQADGKPFLNQKGAQYLILKDFAYPAPGFADQLIGLKKAEEKEFKLQLPADYSKTEFAGKEVSFKVKVNEIKQEKLPELNDEFAQKVNAEFKTLDALKERLSTNLKISAENQANHEFEEQVIDAAVAQAQVAFPEVMVEWEVEHLLEERARDLQREGVDLDTYLKAVKKTHEQLHEEMHPAAEKRIIRSLVLNQFVEAEKIQATDAEIDAEIEKMLANAGDKKDDLAKVFNAPPSRESIRQLLVSRKAVSRLVEIAKAPAVEIKEVQPK